MGQTRVIYSDATTAEAASALKACGFLESSQGGMFTNPNIPVKIYVVWGKGAYFPELSARLKFPPRIQIHLKCRENPPELEEVMLGAANALRSNSPGTQLKIFNADSQTEIDC
jgi:hypothetical protein